MDQEAIMATQENPKRTELWGTFSVKDHVRPRAFVAEVLLYDRLVIPRPPTREEEQRLPGEADQSVRWGANGWKPGRLRDLLDILGEHELAIELPWGDQARRDWQKLYDGKDPQEIGAKRAETWEMARYEV